MRRGLLVVMALLLVVSLAAISCAAPAPAPAPVPVPKPAPAPAPIPKPAPKVTPAPAPAEVIHLRFSTGYPPPPAIDAESNEWVMNEITKRTDGRVTFDKFWGGALGGVKEHLDMIGGGIVDLGECPLGAWPERAPLAAFGANAFPFGPADPVRTAEISLKLLKEFPDYDTGQLADDNVKLLGIWMWDTYDVLSKTPLRTLDDFKGKKCGAWGIYYPRWLEAIGATGISTPAVERYIMLKQGLIDATFHPIEAHVSGKDYEVAKHYTFLSAGVGPNKDIVMNLDVWNGLPADIKKVFTDVYTERVIGHGERCLEIRGEKQAFMETQGVTFYTLGEADKEEWAGKIEDLVKGWVERMDKLGFGAVARKMAKRWVELSEEAGHTWYPAQKVQWSWFLK